MKRILYGALTAFLFLLPATPALAAAPATPGTQTTVAAPAGGAAGAGAYAVPINGLIAVGAAIGAGIAVVGGGKGIGMIGAHAVDATARQPEMGGRIFTTMIISAALIEGIALFAIVIALLCLILLKA